MNRRNQELFYFRSLWYWTIWGFKFISDRILQISREVMPTIISKMAQAASLPQKQSSIVGGCSPNHPCGINYAISRWQPDDLSYRAVVFVKTLFLNSVLFLSNAGYFPWYLFHYDSHWLRQSILPNQCS